MNPEVKKRWVEALRSGKYVQGTSYLRQKGAKGDKFCCLGVLCDLYAQERGSPWYPLVVRPPHISGSYVEVQTFMGTVDLIPTAVQLWAGLRVVDPVVEVLAEQSTLSHLNDEGRGFEFIAEVIEKQL